MWHRYRKRLGSWAPKHFPHQQPHWWQMLFSLGYVKFKAFSVSGHHCTSLCLCRVQMFSLFLEKGQKRNALCTFNPSHTLLSGSDLFILCLWSLLLKADPSDVGAWMLTRRQKKASWTGLQCDSHPGGGLPKGIFRFKLLCSHTNCSWNSLHETWNIISEF